jgi:hypothetical protein
MSLFGNRRYLVMMPDRSSSFAQMLMQKHRTSKRHLTVMDETSYYGRISIEDGRLALSKIYQQSVMGFIPEIR